MPFPGVWRWDLGREMLGEGDLGTILERRAAVSLGAAKSPARNFFARKKAGHQPGCIIDFEICSKQYK